MIIGSMKEVYLTKAKQVFLFDCRVAGLDSEAIRAYRGVLDSLIHFTGDIQVRQLTPEHIRMYVANLSDGPSEGNEHEHLVMRQYAMIHTWIHWMYIQKYLTERTETTPRQPGFTSLFPSRITWRLARYWKYPLSV